MRKLIKKLLAPIVREVVEEETKKRNAEAALLFQAKLKSYLEDDLLLKPSIND